MWRLRIEPWFSGKVPSTLITEPFLHPLMILKFLCGLLQRAEFQVENSEGKGIPYNT